jgi:hypothetical protein
LDEFVILAQSLLTEKLDKVKIPWIGNDLLDFKTKVVGRKRGRDNANTNTDKKKQKINDQKYFVSILFFILKNWEKKG